MATRPAKRPAIRKTLVKGDRVELDSGKIGTIMFKGTTGFAKGEWYGIELDLPEGKHDGYIKKDMKRYFKAKKNHGTFVQRKKIVALAGKTKQTAPVSAPTSPKEDEPTPAVDVAVVEEEKKEEESVVAGCLSAVLGGGSPKAPTEAKIVDADGNLVRRKLVVEDRVTLESGLSGTIRFIGETQFKKGEWFGVELDMPRGKHDGMVGIKRYFKCGKNKGVFVLQNKIKILLSREKSKAIKVSRSMKLDTDMIIGLKSGQVAKIRWSGNPRNVFGSLHYGLELRDGGGDGDGIAHGKRHFKTPPDCAVYVPRSEIVWRLEKKEWARKGVPPALPAASPR